MTDWIVTLLLLSGAGCAADSGVSVGDDATLDASAEDGLLDSFPLADADASSGEPTSTLFDVVTTPEGGPCLLVAIRTRGGLTMHGLGQSQMLVRRDGMVWFDDQAPEPAVVGALPEDIAADFLADVQAIDPDALDDGYGPCCAEYADGSDFYIRFPGSDQPDREVRVSNWTSAPEALRQVLERHWTIAEHLRQTGQEAQPGFDDCDE